MNAMDALGNIAVAGAKAVGALNALLHAGLIPEPSRDLIAEIIKEYDKAQRDHKAAIGYRTGSAP